ncbi:MAG: methyltransferase domain-containing protein [Anaerolineae bacterium]|nr:MAG: methyltransferase domain-containing protein [Anaerolineae bacterium]
MKLDHFGLLAPLYERMIRPQMPETLHALANLPCDGRLLDVGGGTGRVAQFFRREAAAVVLADESLRMLAQARQKDGLHLLAGQAEGLPFGGDSFDRVICVDAFHHLADQERALAEMWRVLRPGGRMVIEEPDIRHPLVILIAVVEKLTLMRSHFRAPETIARRLAAMGGAPEIRRRGFTAWVIADKAA